jgi:hypothetical protein
MLTPLSILSLDQGSRWTDAPLPARPPARPGFATGLRLSGTRRWPPSPPPGVSHCAGVFAPASWAP